MSTWLNVKEYMELTGKTSNAVYTMKAMDSKKNKAEKYKFNRGQLLIDVTDELQSIETQKLFEQLYYELIDKYPSEYALGRALSPILKKAPNTIVMYFRDCFFTVKKSIVKQDYVLGMQLLSETNNQLLEVS